MLKTQSKVLAAVLLLMGALILAGCPTRTTIEKINRDPGRYAGKEVTIAGRVTNSFGALGTGVFELEDGTGRMWVVSEKYGVPSKDSYVGVSGKVVPGLTYNGRNYGTGMQETRRRSRGDTK